MRLSRGARKCLELMKRKFFKGKMECWPRRATIAREMDGISVRQVARYLAELKDKNVLSVNRRPNTSAIYILRVVMSSPMSSPNVLPILTEKSFEVLNPPTPQAQSATEPGPEQKWGGQPQTYFGARRAHNEPSAVSRPQLSIEEREALRDARKLYPMASYDNLMECVRETLAAGMRKPPASEQGQNVFATAEVPR